MIKRSVWGRRHGVRLGTAFLAATIAFTPFSSVMHGSIVNAEDDVVVGATDQELSEDISDDITEQNEAALTESFSGPVVISGRSFNDQFTDVWDFGASDSGRPHSNFRTDEDTINSFYPGVDSGMDGEYLPSFSLDDGELEFFNGGNPAKLNSKNRELTRFSTEGFGSYRGYISCGKSAGEDPYFTINCRKDDYVTLALAHEAECGYSEILVERMEGAAEPVSVSATEGNVSFFASEAGRYKIYSGNGYLGIAHIEREPAKHVTVSGHITGYMGEAPLNVIFTAKDSDYSIAAPVVDGEYTAELSIYDGSWGFYVSIDQPGYELEEDYFVITKNRTLDITLSQNQMDSIKGKISGVSEDFIKEFADNEAKVALEKNDKTTRFYSDAVIENDGSFDLSGIPVEPGEYDVVFKSSNGKVYARYNESVAPGSNFFDIDATYGDYKTRDTEVSIVCSFEGVSADELKGVNFRFSSADYKKGRKNKDAVKSGEYAYYELASGVIRLSKNKRYSISVTGLPEGIIFDAEKTKDLVLSDENYIDGKYYTTLTFKRIIKSKDLNLKDFGAIGDGVADDTEAVREALIAANGKRLYVPEGNYNVTSIELPDITVDMYSDCEAWFCKSDIEAKPMFLFSNCTKASFTGIAFNGGTNALNASVDSPALHFVNSGNITVNKCRFIYFAARTIAFTGNAENITVNENGFMYASGLLSFTDGTARHVLFEKNSAYIGYGDGISISESGKATDSFDIVIKNNEFHEYRSGSAVRIRGISQVRIEDNYIDSAKYFIMSPRPIDKKQKEAQLIDVTATGNHGDAATFVYLFSADGNKNTMYSKLIFTGNAFKLKNGMTICSCDNARFSGNHFNMPGNASVTFENSKNISLAAFKFDTTKSRKKLFRFNACDEVTLRSIDYSAERDLMQVVNSDNANIKLED